MAVMRRLWRGCAALGLAGCLAAAGCNADVPGTSGFGSGGENEPTGGSEDDSTPSSGSQTQGQTQGGDASASSADGTGSDTDSGPGSSPTGGPGEETDGAETDGMSSAADADASGSSAGDGDGTGGESSGTSGTATDSDAGTDSGAGAGTDPCGFALDGPWLEIEYWQSGVPATSPSWAYSDTPGWGEDEWAAQNASWPEVWDIYQNINVVDDPIGVVAVVGSSGRLQLMLGFEELLGYDSATLCIEGRSVSAVASVQFDAYNPLTGWGNSAMMAHDWEVHAVGIELGQPFEIGGGVQAIRLDTTGGSGALGVQRMRLILHGAVY